MNYKSLKKQLNFQQLLHGETKKVKTRLALILTTALILTACSNKEPIDPRQHLADEQELDDETLSQNKKVAETPQSENVLPTTVFYGDPDKTYTYDYLYMVYTDNAPIGVHRKVQVSGNHYTILEDDDAILTKENDLQLMPTTEELPQDIVVVNRSVQNNTLHIEKFYEELSMSEALTYLNNLDVGVSDNGIVGNLFVPDTQYSERPYSVEIERNADGTPSIIRLIGYGTGVLNDDSEFTDFATYEFHY